MPTAISTIFGLLHINCFLLVPLPKVPLPNTSRHHPIVLIIHNQTENSKHAF
jgi:hypothetical protein